MMSSGSEFDHSGFIDWDVVPFEMEEEMAVRIALRRSREECPDRRRDLSDTNPLCQGNGRSDPPGLGHRGPLASPFPVRRRLNAMETGLPAVGRRG